MGKLRHIAVAVSNTHETARFYEQAFGMTCVRQSARSIMLADDVISLAMLENNTSLEALGHNSLHHAGFTTDNVEVAACKAGNAGTVYTEKAENVAKRFENRGQLKDGQSTDDARQQEQRKYTYPNGRMFCKNFQL
jgi:catechol 2,3-dioxygenase-like lactoylglutathione lyase family enzyme